eukprot:3389074-Pyramimonas_sp.AAC.1
MLQIPFVFWILTPPIRVRGASKFQKCGTSLVFLDPDPADLREGCKFLFTPAIQSTRSGRAKTA